MESSKDSEQRQRVALAFRLALDGDRERGEDRSLRHYLERFSGHENLIAAEYLSVQRGDGLPTPTTPPSEPDADQSEARPGEAHMASFEGLGSFARGANTDDSVGTLGPYVLERELGRGGQGAVFLAEDTRLGRKVALKILNGLGPGAEEHIQRFRREAELAGRLDHPGICGVYEAGIEGGVPFIAMRYVEGESLAQRISTMRMGRDSEGSKTSYFEFSVAGDKRNGGTVPCISSSQGRIAVENSVSGGSPGDEEMHGTVPAIGRTQVDATLALFEKAARALHAVHELGLIHRDIKPGNIMVTEDGEPILLDFGLAKEIDGEGPSLTQSGDLFGTPAFMSPEQIAAKRIGIDRRTDIYSLGVTLFLCLTMRRPFEAPTREGLYQAILQQDPPNPRKLNPAIPPELRIVLACALEKDADRRYATAEDFAEDLMRVRELRPIAARPVSRWLRTKRWAQRNPVVATMSVAMFIFLAVGFVWTFAKNRELDGKNVDLAAEKLRADGKTADAEFALADVERLSDARILKGLVNRAENDLWPAVPSKTGAMKTWLDESESLVARADQHRETLKTLRERADPYTVAMRQKDWASELAEIDELESRRAEPGAQADGATGQGLDQSENDLDDLRKKVKAQGSWSFEITEDGWQHELLADLVGRLDVFTAEESGTVASVRHRLAFATDLEKRTIEDHATLWQETITGISESEKYSGLRPGGLKPQVGLIPLGMDRTSKLYEFLHLASHEGELPERDENERLLRTEKTGIILVLIPGGRFGMGAQIDDPAAPNYDPNAGTNEAPIHTVTLSAFLLSKYEMTQGQWARTHRQETPSFYGAGKGNWGGRPVTLLHPVEQVSWEDCDRAVRQLNLLLPTEAQWEYAARAGTSSIWHTGAEASSLKGFANIADAGSVKYYGKSWPSEKDFTDGYAVHAPVGSLSANDFGLHDVHGNVFEWCRDFHARYSEDNVEAGTGLRRFSDSWSYVLRGGSYGNLAGRARSASRFWRAPIYRSSVVGLRVSARVK